MEKVWYVEALKGRVRWDGAEVKRKLQATSTRNGGKTLSGWEKGTHMDVS